MSEQVRPGVCQEARSMARPESCSVEAATCYVIHTGDGGWARIFTRDGTGKQGDGAPRYWVDLSIISDFGNYGYCWSHIGGDWRAFLRNLDFHYAMQKLAGEHFMTPLQIADAIRKARDLVLDGRRNGMAKADARELWDALDTADFNSPHTFLTDLDNASGGAMYRNEFWDSRWIEPSAAARGFWREIWPLFLEALSLAGSTQEGDRTAPRDAK